MNYQTSLGSRRLTRSIKTILGCCFAALSLAVFGQPTTTGTISGRVFNPATQEYVRNAEVRLQGTERLVTTESDGSFTLANVPTGAATILVSYTGYNTATVNLNVVAGATATADVNLTSPLYHGEAAGTEVVKLEAFTVSSEREGNAKAIMDQRHSMEVSNIVAADSFGAIAEGNIGEFVKYLPGIQMDYVEADARSPRIRGLPAQFTTVTFDGMKIASADGFIQNNGTDNGGAAGAGTRSFGFEQVSMSSIDAVEINFTTNASQDADSPAGNINLRPKHAYERNRQIIAGEFSLMGNSEQLYWRRTVRPDDTPRRKIVPNGLLEYSNSFFHNRLGLIVSFNESNSYNEQRQFVPTYDTTPTATDPRPIVLTRIQYKDGPKFSERTTGSFTLDYKATDRLSFALVGTINTYAMNACNRSFGVTTTRANLANSDGWTSWNNVPITALTGAAGAAFLNKRTHGWSYIPSFEYKTRTLLVTGSAVFSSSENNYSGGQSKDAPGNNLAGVSLALTGLTVNAVRDPDNLYGWKVTQTGGLDWANLANYKASATGSPTFAIDGRYNRTLVYQGKVDVKYITPLSLPTWVKVGGKVSEQTYIFQNPTAWQTWNYSGPGGGPGGSWANYPSAFVFEQGHGGFLHSISGGTPAVADHNTVGKLFESHPEYFTPAGTAANYLTAFVQQPRYIREQVDSLYGLLNSKPFSRIEVQAGLRYERTRDLTKDFNPLGSAKVIAAGYPVTATTGVASTIPGIAYQYFSQPRVARGRNYDALYPSASVKYSLTPNLQTVFGYSYTVSRPSLTDLAGTYSENDVTQEITAPNPNLKPNYANNYSARVMYYFEPVGSLGVGVFENDFKNFTQSQRVAGGAALLGAPYDDPFYDTYTLITKQNVPGTVIYRGLTLEYSQSLSFLPKPFNGLNVFANYTRTLIHLQVPDESQLHVSGSPYNFGWLPGTAPHVVNYGVNYKYRRLTLGFKARWTADTPTTNTYNTWMNQNTKIDANAAYSFSDRWSVYFNARNLFNVEDHTYVGTNRQQIGGGRAIEYYGAYLYAGVKARF